RSMTFSSSHYTHFSFFFFDCHLALHHLHSFPTRRSSDLIFEIPKQLGFVSQLRVRRFKQKRRGRSATGVVSRGDDAQAFPNQFRDRKSTRLNSSHVAISYAVFCLKKKKKKKKQKQKKNKK